MTLPDGPLDCSLAARDSRKRSSDVVLLDPPSALTSDWKLCSRLDREVSLDVEEVLEVVLDVESELDDDDSEEVSCWISDWRSLLI